MFTGNLYNSGIITVIDAVHVGFCSSMNITVIFYCGITFNFNFYSTIMVTIMLV